MLGKFNLGALMKGAQKIQEMLEKNQADLANLEAHGEAGAGLVKVTISGLYAVKHLEIADELLKEPKQILEELIAAAVTNATQKVTKIAQSKMSDMSQLFSAFGDEKSE